jgi:hypothetical protein
MISMKKTFHQVGHQYFELQSHQTTIRKQFPIQLACARTIHRAQGLTLDKLAFDPRNIRTHGLVLRALSRVKTMNLVFLIQKITQENFCINKKVTT